MHLNSLRIINLIICFLVLAGCSMNTNYDPKSFAEEKRAMIIVGCPDNPKAKTDKNYPILKSSWTNLTTNEALVVNTTDFLNYGVKDKEAYLALSVTPGKYSLHDITYWIVPKEPSDRDVYNVWKKGATFEVKPGEVVYIGDLILEDRYYGKIAVKDSFEKAQEFLNSKHHDLATRLEKRLINISPSFKLSIPPIIIYTREIIEINKKKSATRNLKASQ